MACRRFQKIVEEGPPEQIFGHPSHERTRAFLRRALGAIPRLPAEFNAAFAPAPATTQG